jgi:hypothetical protein
MGYHADPADFVQPGQAPGGGDLPVAEWTWAVVPAPAAGPVPRAREWELTRYRQYRAWLAGHRVGQSVGEAVAFLSRLPAVGDHAGKNSLTADRRGNPRRAGAGAACTLWPCQVLAGELSRSLEAIEAKVI